jgi:hypothetical protein
MVGVRSAGRRYNRVETGCMAMLRVVELSVFSKKCRTPAGNAYSQPEHAALPMDAVGCSRRIRRRLPCDRSQESSNWMTPAEMNPPSQSSHIPGARPAGWKG